MKPRPDHYAGTTLAHEKRCPTCGSDDPRLHNVSGDLAGCPDPFHSPPSPQPPDEVRTYPPEVNVDIDGVGEPFVCDEDGGMLYVRRDEARSEITRLTEQLAEVGAEIERLKT